MELRFRGEARTLALPLRAVPAAESELIAQLAPAVSYGWGMIPATVRVGDTTLPTSRWPKDGAYIVPLKTALREHEGVEEGDAVEIALLVGGA
ncbi:DUF1905 domain-containing protein [Herbiconiux ginsengi]|uniref:DUF1905 domain-containing protein n=1 Tax=Herbiconiux ginsengi TaxID=381665 RepID=UPI001FDF3AF3|nr:DUF1905 domain-containing protein [Herbiconiux ginsengi]